MHWSLTMIIPLVASGVIVALGYRINRPDSEFRPGMSSGGFHQGILARGCLIFVGVTIGNWAALIPMGQQLIMMHGESNWLRFGQWGVAVLMTGADLWCVVTLDDWVQKRK